MPHTLLAALVAITASTDVQAPGLSSLRLPGGPPVGMDYLAYDAHSGLLFVPASNTGKLDVIDTRTGKLRSVDGWPTAQRDDRIAGIAPPGSVTSEATRRIAAEHGFVANTSGPRTGLYDYADIDDDFISIHHWLKWYKFGFTRLFDNLSLEIRNGRITREAAVASPFAPTTRTTRR